MASNSNIDMEGASQHLRDILKLDRPSNIADAGSGDDERKISFNGEMNGLGAGLLGAGGGPGIAEKPGPVDVPQEAQIICLSGDDGSTCIPITSNNVEIVASRDSSIDSKARGSNKVKIQPVAKYDWEHKYYYGNLITVSNTFLAYAIIGASSQAMVRVLTLGSTAERTLLKGFRGAVTDLAFAHLDSPLLAAVDQAGNLLVWRLTCSSSKILDQVVVHVRQPDSAALSSSRRLIWCPYILEDQEDQEDGGQTLALLHDDRAEVWDLEVLRSSNNSWPVDAADLKDGLIIVKGHTEPISEGALSPDGTVLATASHDGYLKFWQIYNEGGQDQPRCLHDWKPHGGNPLSCLLFCDNHKKQDPDVSFWRFLITGAEQNQELKLWCTVSWTCLQTIRFSPDPFNSLVLPSLKASLDLAAECLILTDVQRKVLYVLELLQDQESGRAGFRAVSEFLLTHPVLSFALQDVRRARLRHTDELPADEESESMTTEGNQGPQESKAGIHIKLYCVHTKSLQDVQIWFQPHLGTGPAHFLPLANSQDGFGGFSDQLMDLGVEPLSSDRESAGSHDDDLQKIPSLPAPADFLSPGGGASGAMPKLMTPDAFMTPSASVPASPGSSASSLTIVTAMSSNSDTPSRLAEDLTQSPVSQQVENLNLGSRTISSLLLSGLDGLQASAVLSLDAPAGLDAPLLPPQASPLLPPQASPTRTRSPDVISSASTALSQDIPEIASQTLQRSLVSASSSEPLPTLHNMADSMASAASALHLLSSSPSSAASALHLLSSSSPSSAASALHLLSSSSPSSTASALHLLSSSPRGRGSTDHTSSLLPLELGGAVVEGAEQRLSHTPSLLENALSQENAAAAGGGAGDGNGSHAPWPAAPDITRETRNSLRDNGLGDCSREELKDRHMSSPYHRRSYQLTQNDSQDASAEQSDHDDEVASLASSSGAGPVGVRASHRLPAKDWKTSPRSSPKLKRKSKKDDGEACQNRQMEHHQVLCGEVQEEVLLLLRGQQRELAELRQELQRISSHMDLVQSSVVSHVDRALAGHQDQQQRRLERVLMESHARNQQLHEQLAHSLSSSLSTSLSSTLSTSLSSSLSTSLSSSLSTSLSSSLSSRLDKTLREEMKKSVPQTISKVLEPVTAQLSSSIAAKLTAVEGALKDNVSKVVKSKNTTDAIGRAAAEAMQGPIQAAYKDAFQSIVLPVFERGCQAMFQQINESFKSGTNEYIQQLETHLKNRKQRDQEPLIGQMQQMIDNFQNSTDALANSVTASVRTEVQHQLHMTVGNLQESIFTQVQRIVKGEVGLALKEQQAVVTSSIMQAMRSAAGTPVPSAHLDYQAQQGAILSLLQQGQLNQAFQQALSATDLSLVLYVCESVDSQQVFSQQPCPLIQPVLLSLIQQLASNLTTRTELKISYLEDAVMNLDHGDPVTRDHLSNVLAQVRTKLFQFLQQDPHGPLAKRARRLMMMLQGLVNH